MATFGVAPVLEYEKSPEAVMRIAKKLGVHTYFEIMGDNRGFLILTGVGVGDPMDCVVFDPWANRIRFAKPGAKWVDGDFAAAIAAALIRNLDFLSAPGELLHTIRSLGDLIG
jgi:hypothetical protein